MEKYFKFEEDEGNIDFDQHVVFDFHDRTRIFAYLNSTQEDKNAKGLTNSKRIIFDFSVEDYTDISGVIKDFQLTIDGHDGTSEIIKLDEVDPENLYHIGELFMKVAKYYGIDRKELKRLSSLELKERKRSSK